MPTVTRFLQASPLLMSKLRFHGDLDLFHSCGALNKNTSQGLLPGCPSAMIPQSSFSVTEHNCVPVPPKWERQVSCFLFPRPSSAAVLRCLQHAYIQPLLLSFATLGTFGCTSYVMFVLYFGFLGWVWFGCFFVWFFFFFPDSEREAR